MKRSIKYIFERMIMVVNYLDLKLVIWKKIFLALTKILLFLSLVLNIGNYDILYLTL